MGKIQGKLRNGCGGDDWRGGGPASHPGEWKLWWGSLHNLCSDCLTLPSPKSQMVSWLSYVYLMYKYVSLFDLSQLLKFGSSESPAAPFYGFNPTSTLPCIRLKYRNTQRTTSPVNHCVAVFTFSWLSEYLIVALCWL